MPHVGPPTKRPTSTKLVDKHGRPFPNPNPGPKRWYMAEYHHSWVDDTLHITLSTDVPCHLWLFWTKLPTRVHNRTDWVGGVGWYWEPRYCFVGWETVEQDEAGDTLLHHFSFPGWYTCQTRWWGFAGTIEGNRSPSCSPILHSHYQTFVEDESMRHVDLTDKEVAGIIDHADSSVLDTKIRYPFTFVQLPFTAALVPVHDYHMVNKKYVDDAIAAAVPSIWQRLVEYGGAGAATYTRAWAGSYQVLMVLIHTWKNEDDHRCYLRFNGQAGGVDYDTLATYVQEGGAVSRYEMVGKDRLYLTGADVGAGHPFSYKAIIHQVHIDGAFQPIHWQSSKDDSPATIMIMQGVHICRFAPPLNSITVYERLNRDFNIRLSVYGITWL